MGRSETPMVVDSATDAAVASVTGIIQHLGNWLMLLATVAMSIRVRQSVNGSWTLYVCVCVCV